MFPLLPPLLKLTLFSIFPDPATVVLYDGANDENVLNDPILVDPVVGLNFLKSSLIPEAS